MTRLRICEESPASTAWMVDAACVRHSALPWVEDLRMVPRVLIDIMREVCAECPVRTACANYAVQASITAGWWAGTNLNAFTRAHPPTPDDLAAHDDRDDLGGDAA